MRGIRDDDKDQVNAAGPHFRFSGNRLRAVVVSTGFNGYRSTVGLNSHQNSHRRGSQTDVMGPVGPTLPRGRTPGVRILATTPLHLS
jgi:hypothetical protein